MIAWSGFLGRLLQFCVEKLAGKRIDIALDPKKQAARSFLKLYDSILGLESLCAEFLKVVQPVVNGQGARLHSRWVRGLSKEVDHASAAFLSSAAEIVHVLEFFDPALGLMLGQICRGKFAYLALSSGFEKMTFRFDWGTEPHLAEPYLKSLTFTAPSEELESLDFETVYRKALNVGKNAWRGSWGNPEASEWPKDSLLNLLDGRIVDRVMLPGDVAEIKALYQLTQEHLAVLTEARHTLRSFVAGHFSIDDLLYVRE